MENKQNNQIPPLDEYIKITEEGHEAHDKLLKLYYSTPPISNSKLFRLFKEDIVNYQTAVTQDTKDSDPEGYTAFDLPNLEAFTKATNWTTLIDAIANAAWDFPSFLNSLIPIILKFEAIDPYDFQDLIIGILHTPPHQWDT